MKDDMTILSMKTSIDAHHTVNGYLTLAILPPRSLLSKD